MGKSAEIAVPSRRVYTPEIPDNHYCEIDSVNTLWLVGPKRRDGLREIVCDRHTPRQFVGTVEKAPGMGGVIRIVPQGGIVLRVSKYLLYKLKIKRKRRKRRFFNNRKRGIRRKNLFIRRL